MATSAPHKQGTSTQHVVKHDALQEERYLWMARAFVVMLVLAVICNIFLLIALANVTPVMRVQPFFLRAQNKYEQIIDIERPSFETLNSEVLKMSLVEQYLQSRYGIGSDVAEVESRWSPDGPVAWMSDRDIFDEFTAREAGPSLKLAREDDFTRNVRILSTVLQQKGVNGVGDIWEVKMEWKEMNRASSDEKIRHFTAQLKTEFRPTRAGLQWKDRLKNPLGFTVSNYGIAASK